MGLLLALTTFVGWGTGDIFSIFPLRKIGLFVTSFWVLLFGFLIASLYLPFTLSDIQRITLPTLMLNIVLGFGFLSGNILAGEAFRISSAPLVGILIQSASAIVLILSALIFKDTITLLQIVCVITIFAGVVLCSVDIKEFKKISIKHDRGITLALIAMTLFSLYFTFMRIPSHQYGWFLPNYISFSLFPLIFILFKYKKVKLVKPKSNKIFAATFLSALLLRGGDIALNYGLANGYSSIVAPIGGASPILFVTLSSIIFKDKMSKQQFVGIAIVLLGILLLSLSNI